MENKQEDAPVEESVLITAAKSLGKMAGRIASVVTPPKSTPDAPATEVQAATQEQPTKANPQSPTPPARQTKQKTLKKKGTRPVKKNNARLPRKEKKAQKQARET